MTEEATKSEPQGYDLAYQQSAFFTIIPTALFIFSSAVMALTDKGYTPFFLFLFSGYYGLFFIISIISVISITADRSSITIRPIDAMLSGLYIGILVAIPFVLAGHDSYTAYYLLNLFLIALGVLHFRLPLLIWCAMAQWVWARRGNRKHTD